MEIFFNIGLFLLSIVIGVVIWLFIRKKEFDIVIVRSMFYVALITILLINIIYKSVNLFGDNITEQLSLSKNQISSYISISIVLGLVVAFTLFKYKRKK